MVGIVLYPPHCHMTDQTASTAWSSSLPTSSPPLPAPSVPHTPESLTSNTPMISSHHAITFNRAQIHQADLPAWQNWFQPYVPSNPSTTRHKPRGPAAKANDDPNRSVLLRNMISEPQHPRSICAHLTSQPALPPRFASHHERHARNL